MTNTEKSTESEEEEQPLVKKKSKRSVRAKTGEDNVSKRQWKERAKKAVQE